MFVNVSIGGGRVPAGMYLPGMIHCACILVRRYGVFYAGDSFFVLNFSCGSPRLQLLTMDVIRRNVIQGKTCAVKGIGPSVPH